MKAISSVMAEKLNLLENFTLVSNDGKDILWDVRAPGLHVLLVCYHYIKYTGEAGKSALLYHSVRGDFFNKTYDILNRAGLTKDYIPEAWGYIRELNKFATISKDPETKASTNIQLFRFIQEFMGDILINDFITRTGTELGENGDVFKKLIVAADSFVARVPNGNVRLLAGYPWFDQSWCRDTFVSMGGLLLLTGRYEYAKSVFNFFASLQNKNGLLPNRVFFNGVMDYNSADGSLWFIEALNKYKLSAKSASGDAFIKKMTSVVNKIISCYTSPSGDIYLDKDNLVVTPAQWTWMDAAAGGKPVTPRNGKPVEIQALFYNALSIASEFNCLCGDKKLAAEYDSLRKKVAVSINNRFFDYGRVYPFDCLDGDSHCNAIRPNALFLISLSMVDDLLPLYKKEAIIDIVEKELMTPYGPRTLTPNDPAYIGAYDTFAPMEIKDLAYHQGTVWPYLMAHYAAAALKISKNPESTIQKIKDKLSSLVYSIKDKDTIGELYSGSEPQHPGGAVSQAWSVSAMMETLDTLNNFAIKSKRQKK
jgi:glycogen debranching enzyme